MSKLKGSDSFQETEAASLRYLGRGGPVTERYSGKTKHEAKEHSAGPGPEGKKRRLSLCINEASNENIYINDRRITLRARKERRVQMT